MKELAGIVAVIILLFLAGIHFYWGAGGKLWTDKIIPERDGLPLFTAHNFGFHVVGILLLISASLILGQIGLIELPTSKSLTLVGVWLLAIVFLLRAVGEFRYCGFFKSICNTTFSYYDSRIYSPTCAVLSALIGFVAILSSTS